MNKLQLIPQKQYSAYFKRQPLSIEKHFGKINETKVDFDFMVKSSSVYSSNIEGNPIDLETYYKYYTSGMNTRTKTYKEIQDLEEAYKYAMKNKLNPRNALKVHKQITKTSDIESKYKGKYRDRSVYVMSDQGKIVYSGIDPINLQKDMNKLFNDIDLLLNREFSISKTFYYASWIHFYLVAIHPFADGNGRFARLVEKWFLAQKLGMSAWGINSEKLYLKRKHQYHKTLNQIGIDYTSINKDQAIPFLKMLPMALRIK